nr:inactive protein RESTRICTED TEV MOVEMENT 2-like [Ipomoea batatas]
MSMKPKSGKAAQSRPPQVVVHPVYEDFRPAFERQHKEEAEKFLVYLPGFPKENIRVNTKGKNMVRIHGEHLVAGNKWNRFQEDFLAPENCDMTRISARFENGILTITMPTKKLVPHEVKETQMTPTPLKKSQHVSPPKFTSPMHSESKERDDNYDDNAKQGEQGGGQITRSARIYMQAVKSLTEPYEKRQLLMSAGAAVLVSVALGAYISLQYRDYLS